MNPWELVLDPIPDVGCDDLQDILPLRDVDERENVAPEHRKVQEAPSPFLLFQDLDSPFLPLFCFLHLSSPFLRLTSFPGPDHQWIPRLRFISLPSNLL